MVPSFARLNITQHSLSLVQLSCGMNYPETLNNLERCKLLKVQLKSIRLIIMEVIDLLKDHLYLRTKLYCRFSTIVLHRIV